METKIDNVTVENVDETPNTTTTTTTTTTSADNNKELAADQIYVPNITIYSMVVFNLPKYMDHKKFDKFLTENKIKFKKSKKIVKESFGHISFDSIEERDEVIKKLENFQFNESTKLKTEIKEEKSDRMKRKYEEDKNKVKKDDRESKLKTIEEIVCPWFNIPYEQQLENKKEQIEKVLTTIKSSIRKESFHNLPNWLLKRDKTKEEKMCCKLEEIVASPVTEYYRNKAQYTIGIDSNNQPCVGFALGRTGAGVTLVADPSNAPIISKRSNEVRRLFNEYIKTSPRLPFDKNSHSGFWRQLTVRDFTTCETMATVQFNHKGLSQEEIAMEKQKLKEYFQSLPQEQRLTSLSVQLYDGISNAAPVDLDTETIDGPDYIHERLLGCQFRVSPNAFFQVNTKATELLYSKVLDWAQVSEDINLLDICCGTGTIGQCISKQVKTVIGLEISPDAIADSNYNAELNKITNAKYYLGKAEETLPKLLNTYGKNEEYIGIVDPPRGGLHGDVLKAIRQFENMRKLVYVSCNQASLVQDAVKLCKGISKSMKGTPFVPVKAIAFDLFPHTDLVELVVLFEREGDQERREADERNLQTSLAEQKVDEQKEGEQKLDEQMAEQKADETNTTNQDDKKRKRDGEVENVDVDSNKEIKLDN